MAATLKPATILKDSGKDHTPGGQRKLDPNRNWIIDSIQRNLDRLLASETQLLCLIRKLYIARNQSYEEEEHVRSTAAAMLAERGIEV